MCNTFFEFILFFFLIYINLTVYKTLKIKKIQKENMYYIKTLKFIQYL